MKKESRLILNLSSNEEQDALSCLICGANYPTPEWIVSTRSRTTTYQCGVHEVCKDRTEKHFNNDELIKSLMPKSNDSNIKKPTKLSYNEIEFIIATCIVTILILIIYNR